MIMNEIYYFLFLFLFFLLRQTSKFYFIEKKIVDFVVISYKYPYNLF